MRRSQPGSIRGRCIVLILTAAALAQAEVPDPPGQPPGDPEERLAALRAEIAAIESSLEQLATRERGILGEIGRLDGELRLRQAEVDEAALRVEGVSTTIAGHDAALERLGRAQSGRERYLAFRLREIYKAGPDQALRRLLAQESARETGEGLAYASYLSARDGRVLAAFREDAVLSARERAGLAEQSAELERVHAELAERRDAVEGARTKRARTLEGVRRDGRRQREALRELEEAAADLARVADSTSEPSSAPALDVRSFKGLLEWPVEGELRAGFGSAVHRDFGTRVPHPGWDLAAEFGADIGAVFDGRVVFADWMRGYGLTVIVDHGGGVLSVYAHASVLLVRPDETVVRGQTLGKVGDTGSLSGSYLYFELRVDGDPVDPAAWLRHR